MVPEGILQSRAMQVRLEKERMENGRSELFKEGVTASLDINYLGDEDPRHTLDVFSPEQAGVLPVILEIHGGGYVACEKVINRLHSRYYAQQGFHVVNGDYTLHPEGDFGNVMREIAAMLTWIDANKDVYHFDTDHVYISGDSAGGHFILEYVMLQDDPSLQEYFSVTLPPIRIKAAAASCPCFRMRSGKEATARIDSLYKLLYPNGTDETYLEHIDVLKLIPTVPFCPVIMITTPGDALLYEQDLILKEAFEKTGRPFRFGCYEEKSHTLGHVFHVLYPEWEESIEANTDILRFFCQY